MTTVDRLEWIRMRIRFLEEFLAGDVPDDQRKAGEAELAQLRRELRPVRTWLGRVLGRPS